MHENRVFTKHTQTQLSYLHVVPKITLIHTHTILMFPLTIKSNDILLSFSNAVFLT